MYLREESHKIEFLNKHNEFMRLFSCFFEDMEYIIHTLNFAKKENWSQSKCYQYLIFPEAIKTLHCAVEITTNGYYDEAVVLMRSVFEHFLCLVFLSKYPDNIEGLLLTGINEKKTLLNSLGVTKYNATNLLKDVLKIKEKIDGSFSFFSLLSTFTHGKKSTLLSEYIDRTTHQKMNPIKIEHYYDETKSNFCINIFIDLQHFFYKSIITLFSTEIEATPQFENKLFDLKKTDKVLEYLAKNKETKEIIDKACRLFLGIA